MPRGLHVTAVVGVPLAVHRSVVIVVPPEVAASVCPAPVRFPEKALTSTNRMPVLLRTAAAEPEGYAVAPA